ncbi:hypothetical protein ACTXT7_017627, partial [Hymenolepis weldensis]
MPKVVPARPAFKPIVPNQQSDLISCLIDHQTNQICSLKGHKIGGFLFASSRTHTSFTLIKSPKCLGQCSHSRDKDMLVCHPNCMALVDDKCKHPEEMGFGKLVPNSKGIKSEWLHRMETKLHFLIIGILTGAIIGPIVTPVASEHLEKDLRRVRHSKGWIE